jgi:hypothetical protein
MLYESELLKDALLGTSWIDKGVLVGPGEPLACATRRVSKEVNVGAWRPSFSGIAYVVPKNSRPGHVRRVETSWFVQSKKQKLTETDCL